VPVLLIEVLQQQLGAVQLHRVRHRCAEAPEPAQRSEFCGRPLPGQQVATEGGAPGHRPSLPGAAHPPTLEVGGVAVEHSVLGGAVALGGQQAGPGRGGYRALHQVHVSFLAGLEHAESVSTAASSVTSQSGWGAGPCCPTSQVDHRSPSTGSSSGGGGSGVCWRAGGSSSSKWRRCRRERVSSKRLRRTGSRSCCGTGRSPWVTPPPEWISRPSGGSAWSGRAAHHWQSGPATSSRCADTCPHRDVQRGLPRGWRATEFSRRVRPAR
jgi:hypothetical protein